MGYIYKITNLINNKCYIGQTCEKNPFRRIKRHFKKQNHIDLVYNAVLKYGEENFKIEVLCCAYNQDDLNYLEEFFIKYYNTYAELHKGYNIKHGGKQGGKLPEHVKQKISLKNKEYYSKNEAYFKGKKFSKTHLENLSKSRKGFDSENRKTARQKSIEKRKKPLIAINIETNEIFTFNSIEECAKKFNLISSCISRVLNNKQNRKQHKGFIFKNKS